MEPIVKCVLLDSVYSIKNVSQLVLKKPMSRYNIVTLILLVSPVKTLVKLVNPNLNNVPLVKMDYS